VARGLRTRTRLALLALVVVLAHLLGLEWFARQADAISGLSLMVAPMYTRMLKPAPAPPIVASTSAPPPVPRARVAPRPRPPASSAEELRRTKEAEEAKRLERERERAEAARLAREREAVAQREREEAAQQEREHEAVAQREREAAAERARAQEETQRQAEAEREARAAEAAAQAASAAASEATAEAPSLDDWPTDTRLTYRLSGSFRGPLFGDARVQWQREGDRYQVRLDIRIQVFGTQVLTSQGEVTPEGLVPREYEELRPRKRRTARIGDQVVTLDNGRTLPRPPGVQDTASQFVELTHRFATGKERLEVGRTMAVWLARPGGVDRWIYDIVEREILQTPTLGPGVAFHLKPRPIPHARGNIMAEMWFAPNLLYLPVRIKVTMGDEAYLDLLVDHIEQR
jgi:hypothetical protein